MILRNLARLNRVLKSQGWRPEGLKPAIKNNGPARLKSCPPENHSLVQNLAMKNACRSGEPPRHPRSDSGNNHVFP